MVSAFNPYFCICQITLILVFLYYMTLLLPPNSLLDCPNLLFFCLFCCYFVADGEKSAVWRWKNDSCFSVLFSRRDIGGRTYSRRGEGGRDHQGEHVDFLHVTLTLKLKQFCNWAISLQSSEHGTFLPLFSISCSRKSTPKFICKFISHWQKYPKQF